MARVIDQVLGATTSSVVGEITRELVNASDGAGLHFDGAAGNISFTPVDLGSKFSHEFVIKADEDLTTGTSSYIVDYEGGSGRFILGFNPSEDSGNFAIYDDVGWKSFEVNPLTDLKVHHIVVTVDGTAAVLYDNGNQVGTATINANHGIDNATAAAIGSNYFTAASNNFEGTIYRCRTYNKALSSAEVRTAYERADVDYSSQYGSQTDLTSGSFAGFGSFGAGVSESGGVLTATGSATGNIASKAISLVANAVYRVEYEILTISGGSGVAINPSGTGGLTPTRTATGVYTETMTTPSDATGTINVYTNSGMGEFSGTLGNITVQRIGCISDYDLAYAQPALSTLIQDRSNAADGVASSSGVTQVQPITQLNSTSARIGSTQLAAGTSPYIPADGSIVADKIGVGVAPSTLADFKANSFNGATIKLINSDYNNTNEFTAGIGNLDIFANTTTVLGAQYRYLRLGVGTTEAMRIDSDGDTTLAGKLKLDDASVAGWIQSNGSVRVDIDNDDSSTDRAFVVSRDNGSATLFSVNELGLAEFNGGITVSGASNWSHITSSNDQSLSLADDAQIQLADVRAGAMLIHIYEQSAGHGAVIFATYFGQPELIAGSSTYFDVADTDGKICIIKSSSSHDVYLKNRRGSSKNFNVLVTAAVLDDF